MGRALATYMLLAGMAFAAQGNKLPSRVAKNAKAAHEALNGKKKAVEPPPQGVPTPAQPVVPLRPSQMPSVAPRVSYQNGALTVVAENSTIADILSAIRSATGIRIEAQGGPSGDRVAAKIGPAAPREVLLSLLQGSRFDYVMLGSATDPEKIERVILTPKLGAGGAAQQAAANTPLRPTVPQLPGDQVNDEGDPNQPDYEDPGAPPTRGDDNQNAQPPDQQAPQQEQPVIGPQPPQAPQQQNVEPQNSTNPNPPLDQSQPQAQQPPQAQVRTPEQMLQDVRRMQQRQQAVENARPK